VKGDEEEWKKKIRNSLPQVIIAKMEMGCSKYFSIILMNICWIWKTGKLILV